MKFHKERTAIKSPLEGLDAYAKAFLAGELQRIPVFINGDREREKTWRLSSVLNVEFRDGANAMPLEVSSMLIKPRASIVDELTRHRHTPQLFVPITGPIMGVIAASQPEDHDRPDPEFISMVPVLPGEALEVLTGAWHTLPFAFVKDVLCLSVMHREDLDSYHDVRDLAMEGWIGTLEWKD